MGYGVYSSVSHMARADTLGYSTKSTHEVFSQRSINNAMSPFGLGIRESRDSKEHPNSFPIIIALDVTGSMGSVPHFLVKDGLCHIMDGIMQAGIKDPQVLFLGIGDHTCDQAPVQVGQFESSDELLDRWLTSLYLEGGGGANDGESYLLAWYLAAKHTETDSFVKRQQRGFLFTIGDEHCLPNISGQEIRDIFGDGQYAPTYEASDLLTEARETYHVYHIHIGETHSGSRQIVPHRWTQLMTSDYLLVADRREDVARCITQAIVSSSSIIQPNVPDSDATKTNEEDSQEMML